MNRGVHLKRKINTRTVDTKRIDKDAENGHKIIPTIINTNKNTCNKRERR